MNELQKIESFEYSLAIAETLEEIKLIQDAAIAYQDLLKRQGIAKEGQNKLGRFVNKAGAKIGEWLNENYPHGGDKPSESDTNFEGAKREPSKMPVSKKESVRTRALVDDKIRNEIEDEIEKEGKIITQQETAKRIKQKEKEGKRKKEEETRKSIISEYDIRHGDFKVVLNDIYDIDAIITDPPYPKEFINCYSELGLYAKDHLKKDGFLAAYSGQYNLPEVIERLGEHLTYVWTFCLYHAGKTQLVNGVNIMCGWKPVLIFSNGRKKMRYSAYDVLISGQREKHSHEWQQSESGVEKLIEIFTEPGELVVDPFTGSGTFLKVAKELGRNGIGAEIS